MGAGTYRRSHPPTASASVGLTYIYGICRTTPAGCAGSASPDTKIGDLTTRTTQLQRYIDQLQVEAICAGSARRRQRPRRSEAPAASGTGEAARQRPADEDERANPQGPGQGRRPLEEEGQVVAPPRKAAKGRGRRRVKKNIAIGQAHIKTSFNNTIVALTDKEGNVIVWESAGSAGQGSRCASPARYRRTRRVEAEHGLQKVEVFVKGPGSGRETAIRSLQAAGLEILGVKDVSPQAHNGVRQKKRRRV
jgi:small subunit ribosomal protein S11